MDVMETFGYFSARNRVSDPQPHPRSTIWRRGTTKQQKGGRTTVELTAEMSKLSANESKRQKQLCEGRSPRQRSTRLDTATLELYDGNPTERWLRLPTATVCGISFVMRRKTCERESVGDTRIIFSTCGMIVPNTQRRQKKSTGSSRRGDFMNPA